MQFYLDAAKREDEGVARKASPQKASTNGAKPCWAPSFAADRETELADVFTANCEIVGTDFLKDREVTFDSDEDVLLWADLAARPSSKRAYATLEEELQFFHSSEKRMTAGVTKE
eukprot:4476254-Amphidinium_carterae.1